MIVALEHVNVRVADIEATLAFYADVLDMRCGPVPGCSDMHDSAWIYAGDGRVVLHVGTGVLSISGSSAAPARGSGSVDHVALECRDYSYMRDRLARLDFAARFNDVPAARQRQIFIVDPDGLCLELNFRDV
jgi:catechol 2,3-dioxygenase-like lactoylglutathione lyase family enzyme